MDNPKDQIPSNEEEMLVTLELDDGSEVECSVLTIFNVKDMDYIALLPLDEDGEGNEEGEIFIYRYAETEDGQPQLTNIESDDEYELVADRFDELLDEAEFDDADANQ